MDDLSFGTPEGTRTPNPQNRNLMLYPLSHRRVCLSIIADRNENVKTFLSIRAKNIFTTFLPIRANPAQCCSRGRTDSISAEFP